MNLKVLGRSSYVNVAPSPVNHLIRHEEKQMLRDLRAGRRAPHGRQPMRPVKSLTSARIAACQNLNTLSNATPPINVGRSSWLKTTLEIPDALLRRAKSAAAQQGIPFREL